MAPPRVLESRSGHRPWRLGASPRIAGRRGSGQSAAPDDASRRSETVVVSGSGGDTPVVARNICPTYRGALVVCQGGGSAEVRLAVTQAVSALTGLSSDRITVVKCQ